MDDLPPSRTPGDDSMRMSHLKVGSAADIPINISETDLSLLTATVVPPSGREEPCLLKRLRNGHVGKRLRRGQGFLERRRAVGPHLLLLMTLPRVQGFHSCPRRLGNTWYM
jgi:hypothetical protein